MPKLKLSELQDDTPVKITVELPGSVHRDLLAYGQALAAEGCRAVEPAKLIVPMISRFMNTDRAFTRSKRSPSTPVQKR
jgi:hypothetical protein